MSFLKASAVRLDPSRIRPLRDRVLVRIDDRDQKTKGGLHVPHVARDLPNTGEVWRIGSEVTEVGVGDRVVIDRHAHADREYLLFEEADGREGRYLLVEHEQVIGVLA